MKKNHKEKKQDFSETVYVYVCDRDDDIPIYAADRELEGCDDGLVAEYKLVRVCTKTTKLVVQYK